MIERELTTRLSLTRPDGRLNPDAVGWARQPLIDTSGIGRGLVGKGRTKRWEYWAVTTPTHVVALVISHLDYAGVNSLWVLDRAAGETILREATTPFGLGVSLPGTLGRGGAALRTRHLDADVTETFDDDGREATRIRVRTDRVTVDVLAHRPVFDDGQHPGGQRHESLAVVVPWTERLFQYTVKDVCRPATGTIAVDGTIHDVVPGESWATLDHGRGRWPHDITWNWGAGSGTVDGHTVGIQVGGKWTEGTGSVENSLYLDGRLTKISQELDWRYDLADPRAPWRVTGDDLDLTLMPFHVKESHLDLKVLGNDTVQVFGHWCGRARFALPDGTREWRQVRDLVGWAEDVHNRW
ncbi:DUF2804 domain-containing protein [Nocardioides yefusunii]|uniref:DUF2804 domain-containing protein n=1 Tax=Nocardioides yefusunii TaxID=2500546 RepID=A0ABW1QZ13_9ACTN|nr:DUF2804 domain-containing protein [Nocardioides yefusunii]